MSKRKKVRAGENRRMIRDQRREHKVGQKEKKRELVETGKELLKLSGKYKPKYIQRFLTQMFSGQEVYLSDTHPLKELQRFLGGYAHSNYAQEYKQLETFFLQIAKTTPSLLFTALSDGRYSYISGLLRIFEQRDKWICKLDGWKPKTRNPRVQFRRLARHLFAKYPVPQFLDSIFLEPRPQQELLDLMAYMGSGKNIRKAPLPVSLTKKMAHLFLSAPANSTVLQAIRWGQLRSLNASKPIIQQFNNSFLAEALQGEDETFWFSVMNWFVNHYDLSPVYVCPLLDFIRHRREDEPNFSMKGRTLRTLTHMMDEWHYQLRATGVKHFIAFRSSGVSPGCWTFKTPETNNDKLTTTWRIDEIVNNVELYQEGRAMRHCVYSYTRKITSGHSSIWSLKYKRSDSEKSVRVLTVELNNHTKTIVQARGKCNRGPNSQELHILKLWITRSRLTLSPHA